MYAASKIPKHRKIQPGSFTFSDFILHVPTLNKDQVLNTSIFSKSLSPSQMLKQSSRDLRCTRNVPVHHRCRRGETCRSDIPTARPACRPAVPPSLDAPTVQTKIKKIDNCACTCLCENASIPKGKLQPTSLPSQGKKTNKVQ